MLGRMGHLLLFQQDRSPCPVSYTHLRAHETVLDLVCRLLLEKKNYTENTYYEYYKRKLRHSQLYEHRWSNCQEY